MSSTSAAVIITGGGGFLGQCLATALLDQGSIQTSNDQAAKIVKIILADIFFPPELQPALESSSIVTKLQGDVSQKEYCDSLYDEVATTLPTEDRKSLHISVFHLGAVMSGDGERDFDLCMRVNLYGFINMMEGARSHINPSNGFPTPAKFVFASAGATIGSGAETDYVQKDDIIADSSRATPHTTYGMTKACCELLLADFARRGFVDGRGIRLPTIIVRAGKPNAATTGCFSGIIREPLSGVDVVLPIARDVPHAVTGKRAAIDAMVRVHDVEKEQIENILGFDRTVFLPAVALTLGQLEDALMKTVTPESQDKLGKITYEVDEFLSDVVGGFPTKIDASRALKLGISPAPHAEALVREYTLDFPSVITNGIQITPEDDATSSSKNYSAKKVAVITGAGSGIGRAVAQRLAKGGWNIVLAGRRIKTLHETAQSLEIGDHVCIPTDVMVENDVKNLFSAAGAKYGHVDLLFNNAGINSACASVQDVTSNDFERVFKTNVMGPFLCAREAMKIMAKNGGGRIINNGSISAHVPRPGSVCYTTSKHAVLGMTKCIALDGRAINVACGQIDFGNVVSEMSLATNDSSKGALQANGTMMVEPSMSLTDAAESLCTMANLPLEANVLQMTLMATKMPFVGRG